MERLDGLTKSFPITKVMIYLRFQIYYYFTVIFLLNVIYTFFLNNVLISIKFATLLLFKDIFY